MTKILFIEEDETAFEIRRCIAAVLEGIQPVELFQAKDASEALELLDEVCPDVVIIEHEDKAERELFLDGLSGEHPPVLIDCAKPEKNPRKKVSYVRKDPSLEGIHQLLKTATTMAALGITSTENPQ